MINHPKWNSNPQVLQKKMIQPIQKGTLPICGRVLSPSGENDDQ